MGCSYSKANNCYSLNCCFCKRGKWACYWIGFVGMIWGSFALVYDWLQALMHDEYCKNCLDYELNKKLSWASAIIYSVQWCTSLLLIFGVKFEVKCLVLLWLAWAVPFIVMHTIWGFITIPYMPSIRGIFSIVTVIFAVHYFIVVKTQYTKLALTFEDPPEPILFVPLNTPTRKHKTRKRRGDQALAPPVRVLLGAAVILREESLRQRLETLEARNKRKRDAIRRARKANRPPLTVRLRHLAGLGGQGYAEDVEGYPNGGQALASDDDYSDTSSDESSEDEGAGRKTKEAEPKRKVVYICDGKELIEMDLEDEVAKAPSVSCSTDKLKLDSPEIRKKKEEGSTVEDIPGEINDQKPGFSNDNFSMSSEHLSRRRKSYKIATDNDY